LAGYSGTPLAKKLGIKPGSRLFVAGAPSNYAKLLAPLPDGVVIGSRLPASVEFAHLFTTKRADLAARLRSTLARLEPDGTIWVSWPKKASKVATDITEDTIREVALPLGLVDVKVCAVDETWSGLKLVRRKGVRSIFRRAPAAGK
jgi:hypothetical protein